MECGGNSNEGWNPRPLRPGTCMAWPSCSEWSGVPLSVLFDEVGLDRTQAKWLYAEGAAAAVGTSILVAKAFDDAFVALYQNGER